MHLNAFILGFLFNKNWKKIIVKKTLGVQSGAHFLKHRILGCSKKHLDIFSTFCHLRFRSNCTAHLTISGQEMFTSGID